MTQHGAAEENASTVPMLRRIAPWIATFGAVIGSFSALALILYAFCSNNKAFSSLLLAEVRPIIGIPLAAVSSFCVVWVLQATSGRIEFEIGPLKFRGASGPVVLWVLGFMALVTAIRLLWS